MNKINRTLQLEKIEQVENRLKARKQKMTNSIKSGQRKQKTRMKILLGSLLLKEASTNPAVQGIILKQMVSRLSERDQKVFKPLFESWSNQQ